SPLNLNHFKCYRVRSQRGVGAFRPRDVDVTDQFETKRMTVVKPILLCNPAEKNDEGTVAVAGEDHLTCYKVKDAAGFAKFTPQDVTVMDQFAAHDVRALRGTCRKSSFLCVPSLKNPTPPTTSTTIPTTSTSVTSTSTSSTASSSVTSTTSTTST